MHEQQTNGTKNIHPHYKCKAKVVFQNNKEKMDDSMNGIGTNGKIC